MVMTYVIQGWALNVGGKQTREWEVHAKADDGGPLSVVYDYVAS